MCMKNKFFLRFFTVLTVLIFILSISVLAAHADPGDGSGEVITNDGGDSGNVDGGSGDGGADSGNIDSGDGSGDTPVEGDGGGSIDGGSNTDDGNIYDTPTESPVQDSYQSQYEQLRDSYINSLDDLDDVISQYTPNANLDSLPTVAPAEVAEATAEPLPDVEVSDATLFSGIIMWLCVAVGISVVAGVMVSKRTHRGGA